MFGHGIGVGAARRRDLLGEVVAAHLDRIDDVDGTINAIPVRRDRDAVLAEAAALDARPEPDRPAPRSPRSR